jgi:hypothetical protein
MSLRLDPRRLAALKLLAAEGGLRPGELVTKWVEERLDAARSGAPAAMPLAAGGQPSPAALAELSARIDALARRVDALGQAGPAESAMATVTPPAKRRGRPPKANGTRNAAASKVTASSARRVPLHDEIAAVIVERGPMTAGELATAIVERGRYTAPRSTKPLDAATVSARVSNPIYRPRFVRNKGRISLTNAE